MSNIGHNIKYLRKMKKLTQQEFADQIGLKRSLIGSYEEKRAEPKSDTLLKMANFFGISTDDMVGERLSDRWFIAREKTQAKNAELFAKNLRILSITVDKYDQENIELVPIKASAGYLNGFSDPDFIAELPRFQLPMLKGGTFRAFELKGDSMAPLLPGTVVIAEYMDDWKNLKSGETYVVISKTEGIVYKRVYKEGTDNQSFLMKSDNSDYQSYSISLDEILEIWKAKAYISMNLPEKPEENAGDLNKINNMMGDLQKQIDQLKKKIN